MMPRQNKSILWLIAVAAMAISSSLPSVAQADTNGAPVGSAHAAQKASLATGSYFTCAIESAGSVVCWGSNELGALGNGTFDDSVTKVQVSGLTSDAVEITAGHGHACALLKNGTVRCWGWNDSGQLGRGTMTYVEPIPTEVPGLSNVASISAGGSNTCALLTTGAVKCWGNSILFGKTISTPGSYQTSPVDIAGLASGVASISVGGRHACALLTTGAVKCWGGNTFRQVGDGIADWSRPEVSQVNGLSENVVAISAGDFSSCALLKTGAVKCWGSNEKGQIGDGTVTRRDIPVDVVGLSSGVASISVGSTHACALITTGAVKCWGSNFAGEIGDGTTTIRTTPVDVVGLSTGVGAIDLGGHTCALMTTQQLKCWGTNDAGQIGDGTKNNTSTAISVFSTTKFGPSVAKTPPVIRLKKLTKGRSIATFVGLKIKKGTKLKISVVNSSRKYCSIRGTYVYGRKVGKCRLTVKTITNGRVKTKKTTLRVVKR